MLERKLGISLVMFRSRKLVLNQMPSFGRTEVFALGDFFIILYLKGFYFGVYILKIINDTDLVLNDRNLLLNRGQSS